MYAPLIGLFLTAILGLAAVVLALRYSQIPGEALTRRTRIGRALSLGAFGVAAATLVAVLFIPIGTTGGQTHEAFLMIARILAIIPLVFVAVLIYATAKRRDPASGPSVGGIRFLDKDGNDVQFRGGQKALLIIMTIIFLLSAAIAAILTFTP